MTDAFCALIGTVCHVYLDNIIVWLQTVEEHQVNVAAVLNTLRRANLYCNPTKSKSFALKLPF